jgi:CheY-like chemotaxis protein
MAHSPSETVILLAEDEVTIRNLVNRMLVKAGYAVILAANGMEALELCRKFTDTIHLLLTNVNMPHLDGIALTDALLQERPDVKIVMMSGDMDNAILAGNRPDAFLRKPFVPPTLLRTIQQVLDGERPGIVQV